MQTSKPKIKFIFFLHSKRKDENIPKKLEEACCVFPRSAIPVYTMAQINTSGQ